MSAVRFADITPGAVVVTAATVRAPALTGAQARAARGLLGWTMARLAAESGLSVSTIKRMDDGEGPVRPGNAAAVRRALERGGAAFRSVDGETWIGPAPGADGARRPA